MTPPKPEKVDIQALDVLYLENLLRLSPEEAAPRFVGTDLIVEKGIDPWTGESVGELKRILDGKGTTEARSLEEERAWVETLRDADLDKNKTLDLAEAQALLKAGLAEEQAASVDPEKFLASVEDLMARRYRPLAENMREFKAELSFRPILDLLEQYNYGILVDEVRQAHSVFSLNSLTKTATNVLAFVPYGVQRLWGEAPVLQGDALAEAAARSNYETRAQAIAALKQAIAEGVAQGEAWALEGRLDEALRKLDAATVAILEDELAATRLNSILALDDRKEAYQKLEEFAQAERPGFLGYGGGNTSAGWFSSFWNYSGRRNNLYIARTLFRFLGVKAATGDAAFDETLHQGARASLADMNGDPLGGFNNMAAVGLTNIFCLGGAFCEPTQWRAWSDEAEMQMVGRMVDGALVLNLGSKSLGSLGDAFTLGRLQGWGQVARVWWGEGSFLARLSPLGKAGWARKLVPIGIWKDARLAAGVEANQFALLGKPFERPAGRIGKIFDRMGESLKTFLFKDLPPLSAAQSAQLKKAAELSGKGLDKLTKGVILLGILQAADDRLAPAFNPFEYGLKDLDREADFEAYPDPTRPEPVLVPATNPQ
ncbi:hypothetical protein FBR05_11695 [Deltaproteobacteria bacterium PRO3]|nr:hypothetical protein [Deltaproteobacteria bacterium PRO3]